MRFWFVKRYGLLQFCEQRRALVLAFLGNRHRRRAVLHIQFCVQLNEPRRFLGKLGFLRERFFKLDSGILGLLLQIRKTGAVAFEIPIQTNERVF